MTMTEQITISSTYNCTVAGTVNLAPNTWDDVKDWFVKWDTLHVTFKDGASKEFEIDSDLDSLESIDWKRPTLVDIFEGEMEFNNELDSDG